jgi:hypothetical protein
MEVVGSEKHAVSICPENGGSTFLQNTYHSTHHMPENSNFYKNYSLLFLFYFSLRIGGYVALVSKEKVSRNHD